MKYRAVIFDFDDTLVESRLLKWAQHKHVAKKFYNLDLTDEDIRQHYGKPFDTLIAEVYRGVDKVENIHQALYSVHADFYKKEFADTKRVLGELLARSIKVGIVSATNKKYLLEDFERLAFPYKNFFAIQASDEVDFHKPDPRVFGPVLANLAGEGIHPAEAVYVGDSLDDFHAAHGAGMDFIGVTTGMCSQDQFREAGAKVVVSNIGEVLNHIE